ncbi:MAG: methyltransferase domain-containing protein [Acidobacteria bacterium]|nr:methyltransferase domain-containing protein [Acidobacteriota bacterium]
MAARRAPSILIAILLGAALTGAASGVREIPYTDAKPILEALRRDVLPADLGATPAAARESTWAAWVSRRDSAIRARLARGDEDSIVNLLLYGTSFTTRPRATERDLSAIALARGDVRPVVSSRVEDFVAALRAPGTNERVQFAREVVEARGMNPDSAAGREQIRRFLYDSLTRVAGEVAGFTRAQPSLSTAARAGAALRERSTMFRDRGLSSDTSIYVNLGLDQALAAITSKSLLAPGGVRRVGIVGPGLDFTDKHDGYDFYPEQSIQPFAVADSLLRLGLAAPGLRVTTFDVSRRINRHLAAARQRAPAGRRYVLHVPRDMDLPWSTTLVNYWERFGDRVGEPAKPLAAPPGVGHVQVRAVSVRPEIVRSLDPHDLNIVLQRLEPLAVDERFDLIIATDVLVYYDVFEQSLALANIARMLRPGGLFLSNTIVFELPAVPLESIAYTDVIYMRLPDGSERGDRIVWYRRQ